MTTASPQRGTQWSGHVIQGALLPALYQAWPTPQESCSNAFWKPHAADSGLFEARWGQALASCPQARAATRKNVKVLCAPAWGSGRWEPVTGRVGPAFCPQQVRGGEGRHFSCDFAFFPAFILISIYLMLDLVFVSSGLFLLCKLLVWFRDTRGARGCGGSSSRSVQEWHVLGAVFTWLCSMTSLRLNPKAQRSSLHFQVCTTKSQRFWATNPASSCLAWAHLPIRPL